jgi:predicted unusual protein kinase regulating ubiquinone biosynthesis (AarF/ABC1/UbiB family)
VPTTEWVDGLELARAVEASDPMRDRWGAALWRCTWTSVGPDRWLHGDPHPGSSRFREDGRPGILDFGATAALPAGRSDGLAQAVVLALRGATVDGRGLLDALDGTHS